MNDVARSWARHVSGMIVVGWAVGAGAGDAGGQGLQWQVRGDDDERPSLGVSLAFVGDLDGDGVSELLSAAHGSPHGAGGLVRCLDGATGSDRQRWSTGLGPIVSAAGDVDGDGVPDLAYAGGVGLGITVRSGATFDVLHELVGEAQALTALGDVDGDGHDDLAASEIEAGIGTVRVFSGRDGRVLWSESVARTSWSYGTALAPMSDANGDGIGDLVVTAPGGERFDVRSGIDGALLVRFNLREGLGDAVASVPDVDGDGIEDLLVGGANVGDGGVVSLRHSITGAELGRWVGEAGDRLGASLACAGDVNVDGKADYLLGAPNSSRRAVSAGAVRLVSGRDGSDLWEFASDRMGVNLGFAVAAGEDVSGDRLPDLAIGAPDLFEDGEVLLYRGSELFLRVQPEVVRAGETITVDVRQTVPGGFVSLFSVRFDSVPFVVRLARGAANGDGQFDWSSPAVPPGLEGHTLWMQAFSVGASGRLHASELTPLEFAH